MPSNAAAGTPEGAGAPTFTWWERLKYAMVRPADVEREVKPDERSAEELEATISRADDRERAIGLIAAPVAALIGFLVIGADISRNSSATTLPKNFVAASTYHWVLLVFLALAVVMLVGAWFRKRIVLAVALALFGVGLFQLGWLGFAVPFVLAGAWYLVRGFRLQTALKRAEGDSGTSPAVVRRSPSGVRPRPNKRYTPPT